MIVDARVIAYMNALDSGDPAVCEQIEKEARSAGVPIIRKEMGNLLKVLITLKQPVRILEVGAAVGYSSILMSEYMPKGCTITTIENYEKRIQAARENFRRTGKDAVITLLEGDAAQVLKQLEGPYDFIFMDAAKGQYLHFLPEILRLMPPGGLLISDNVLQEGEIVQSRFAVPRRKRTIHARMREYLFQLTHHDALQTAVVPIGDGITLSVKRENAATGMYEDHINSTGGKDETDVSR